MRRGGDSLRGGRRLGFDSRDRRVPTGLPARRHTSTRAHVHTRSVLLFLPLSLPQPASSARTLSSAPLVCRIFATAAHYYGAGRAGAAAARVRLPSGQNGNRVNSGADGTIAAVFAPRAGCVFARTRHVLSVLAHYSRAVWYCRPISHCALSPASSAPIARLLSPPVAARLPPVAARLPLQIAGKDWARLYQPLLQGIILPAFAARVCAILLWLPDHLQLLLLYPKP